MSNEFEVGSRVVFKNMDHPSGLKPEIQKALEHCKVFRIDDAKFFGKDSKDSTYYQLLIPKEIENGVMQFRPSTFLYPEHELMPAKDWLWLEPDSLNESDSVNHPSHYNQGKYECIDVAEEIGLTKCSHLFNAFKYVWRCADKHEDPREDIRKAIWYLEYKLARLNEAFDGE